ncbi:MAG: Trigger factor [Dehalococcoidales bacterium]|nr:Trigger factor [Dehalococcoidales bacterium]
MKVTNEKTEARQAFLTIETEPVEVEASLQEAYQHLVKRANIPGFRKGKAPRAILERQLGRERLLDEALNHLIPRTYQQAIKEQGLEAIAQPQVEVVQTDPVIFKVVVPLKPTVKLGDYQSIRFVQEPVSVADGDVDQVVEQLRHQYATWEPVPRPVEFGDMVVLDIMGILDNKPFLNQQSAQYQVIRESSYPLPGFAEQLVGMKKDEEKQFALPFPADYPTAELAGKEALFKVKANEIKQELLPEINDDFAQQVHADFKTVDALRERALADLKARAEERARLDLEERVIDAVVAMSQVEFPPILIDEEINRILNRRFEKGNQEMEEYLKNAKKTPQELHEELHPIASQRVTRALVLDKVAVEEKIEASDADIETEIEKIIKSASENQDKLTDENKDKLNEVLHSPQGRESLRQTLVTRKTMQRLIDIAGGTKEVMTTKSEEGK